MTETLRCAKCSGEVRIVRLNAELLALGHTTNPRHASHAVRLSRPVRESANPVAREAHGHAEGSRGRTEVPDRGWSGTSLAPSLPRKESRARDFHDGAPVQLATGAEVEKRTPRRCPSVPAAG